MRTLLLALALTSFASAEVTRNRLPMAAADRPVGVFDSGTGGLTVLNAIVSYDEHNNQTGFEGPDGQPDFAREDFIYLADQANMPYGNYSSVGKTDLLIEHILKCARFLLEPSYRAEAPRLDKKPVKAVVIACNTATAYGKTAVESMLSEGGSDIQVIGVIDAGARGALQALGERQGTVAVFATAGTVASGGYVRALQRLKADHKQMDVVCQAGVGLAEAIDEEPNFIDHKAEKPRADYKGPQLRAELLPYYNFGQRQVLDDHCGCMQLNSPEGYTRYHIVSLLESMRNNPEAKPLRAMILGCTHYPYVKNTITQVLDELRQQPRYQSLIGEEVVLVDPALNTARELYDHLSLAHLQNTAGDLRNAEFYISVPNRELAGAGLEAEGNRFTYEYKYGRQVGTGQDFVWNVPFSKQNIPVEVAARLEKQVPQVFSLIHYFCQHSPKAAFLRPEVRL